MSTRKKKKIAIATTTNDTRDTRLPNPGAVLTRSYKDHVYRVTVKSDGFVWRGKHYRSVSGAAKAITGYGAVDGFAFFGLK